MPFDQNLSIEEAAHLRKGANLSALISIPNMGGDGLAEATLAGLLGVFVYDIEMAV
jgi:hypothetical protein